MRGGGRDEGGFGRRQLLGAGLAAGAALGAGWTAPAIATTRTRRRAPKGPVMVGSLNGLKGLARAYEHLQQGADPLDAAIEVVEVVEADPTDHSVGLGGLPNEDGVVQLDAAVMHGPTHNSGAVACIENILHPSKVAKLVMERTDHCMLVGRGAYVFARQHGFPHAELLTDEARRLWLHWRETMSERDDRLPPRESEEDTRQSRASSQETPVGGARAWEERITGTIHCSALSATGDVGCTTTTSGLAWKIPGRVGDSPIVGAGLFCDNDVGSAGATGRGEAAIVSCGSAMIVELMRQGASPLEAGLEVLRRVARYAERQARWQPGLLDEEGKPAFGLKFYIVSRSGEYAGVSLRGGGGFAAADPEKGPHEAELVPLFD